MKNNKLLYLLTIFITLFTFNINANAAQGLTCVYEKGGASYKIILIQDTNGTREIWRNNQDASIESTGWEKQYTDDLTRIPTTSKDSNGNLKSCPNFANAPVFEKKVDFFDEYDFWKDFFSPNKWFPQELDKNSSLDYVRRPTFAQTDKPDNDTPTEGDTLIDIDDLDKSKYQAICVYKDLIEDEKYHYIQLIYGKDSNENFHIKFTEFDPAKGENGKYSGMTRATEVYEYTDQYLVTMKGIATYTFGASLNFTAEYFINEYSGNCPQHIYVKRKKSSTLSSKNIDTTILTIDEAGKEAKDEDINFYFFQPIEDGGYNPINGEKINSTGVPNVDIQFEKVNIENCTDLVGEEIAGYFAIIWNLVKIGVPIILIGLGTVDFVQAIFAGKEDEMKKAQGKFIKRIVIAAIIYLVPTLLGFLLKIANSVWPDIGKDICGILF